VRDSAQKVNRTRGSVAAPAAAHSTSTGGYLPADVPAVLGLGAPEVLRLQREVGNHVVARLLAPSLVIQRQKVDLAAGGSVGEGGGNVREQVLAVLDRLYALWSISSGDYGTAVAAVRALTEGSAVGSDSAAMPILLAGLRQNEEATLSKDVGSTQLGVALTGAVGTGKANRRSDILGVQDALHAEWHISNDDYVAERGAISALDDSAAVPDALIPKTIDGIRRLKAAVVKGTPSKAGGTGGGTGGGAAAASGSGSGAPVAGGTAAPVSGGAFQYRTGVAAGYSVKEAERPGIATADEDVKAINEELKTLGAPKKTDKEGRARVAELNTKKAGIANLKARDEIEKTLARKGTTPDAWYGQIVKATFLGVTISNGVHELLATKLRTAEDDLLVSQGLKKEDLGLEAKQGTDGLRVPKLATGGTKVSLHCYGLAVDLNYAGNPYIGLASRGGTGDVIKRSSLLMTGTETDLLDKTQRKAGEAYDALKAGSDAMKGYFAMRGKPEAVAVKAEALRQASKSTKTDAEWVAQIETDWTKLAGKGDFEGTHDPAKGFMDFDKRVVLALTKAGLNWLGAQGGAKDVMHFQLDGVMPR